MSLKTAAQHIEQEVVDFVHKIEHKLPHVIEAAADFGLKYVRLAEAAFNSKTALDFTTLVPAEEPLREGIITILTELESAFKAVSDSYKGGTLLTASVAAAKLHAPVDVNKDHLVLAVQSRFIATKPAEAATASSVSEEVVDHPADTTGSI